MVCRGVRWFEKKGGDGTGIRAVFELEYHQGAPRTGAHKRHGEWGCSPHWGPFPLSQQQLSTQGNLSRRCVPEDQLPPLTFTLEHLNT